MQKKIGIAFMLLLAACAGGVGPIDAKKFLSEQPGPNVPSVQDSLTMSAKNAEKSGDYAGAVQLYKQAIDKDKDNNELWLALADSYRRSGATDNAISVYDQLIAKDPKMISAKEGKALALMAKGDYSSPVPLLTEVQQADPSRWKTLNAFGIILATQNQQNKAQDYFTAALQYYPDSPTVLNNKGLSLALSGKYPEAISSLTRASELSKAGTTERKRIDLNTAMVYGAAGRLDDAKAVASNYLSGAELDNNMGLYAHLSKDDSMARSYLNMALTESTVYYAKAWDNLQEIPSLSPSAGGSKRSQ